MTRLSIIFIEGGIVDGPGGHIEGVKIGVYIAALLKMHLIIQIGGEGDSLEGDGGKK